ncbi:MAG: hypothetical protein ABJN26_22640 [Stappiaceae bacterium]|uniref:hypothetical protein n=1 Tax=Roseibium sp. TaxID=1936156 RepID=UPI003298CEC9
MTAFSELQSGWCAFKNTYTKETTSPKPHDVKLQGKQTGSVITWSPDNDDGPIQSIYSYIETGTNGPEGFVEHSIISIDVQIGGDGSGTLVISSSGAFADVAIAFPSSSIDPSTVLDLQSGNVETSTSSASEIKPETDQVVVDNPDATALLIQPTKDRNFTASFKSADLRQLGGTVHIYGRVADGLAVLNEVAMPRPPR